MRLVAVGPLSGRDDATSLSAGIFSLNGLDFLLLHHYRFIRSRTRASQTRPAVDLVSFEEGLSLSRLLYLPGHYYGRLSRATRTLAARFPDVPDMPFLKLPEHAPVGRARSSSQFPARARVQGVFETTSVFKAIMQARWTSRGQDGAVRGQFWPVVAPEDCELLQQTARLLRRRHRSRPPESSLFFHVFDVIVREHHTNVVVRSETLWLEIYRCVILQEQRCQERESSADSR